MTGKTDWMDVARKLGPEFAERATPHDETDAFVAENFAALKEARLFSAAIPVELGGGGATHSEISAFLRELAHFCPSTALSLSMHQHLVAAQVYKYKRGQGGEPVLKQADDTLVRKTIAVNAARRTVESALEAMGGAGFYRSAGLEKLFRDVLAGPMHPLPERKQHLFTGRIALALDPVL